MVLPAFVFVCGVSSYKFVVFLSACLQMALGALPLCNKKGPHVAAQKTRAAPHVEFRREEKESPCKRKMFPLSDVGWVFLYVAAFGLSDYLVRVLRLQHGSYLLYYAILLCIGIGILVTHHAAPKRRKAGKDVDEALLGGV